MKLPLLALFTRPVCHCADVFVCPACVLLPLQCTHVCLYCLRVLHSCVPPLFVAADSLEQYYASRYPSIHTSSGRVPLACTFSSPSLATFPTPSGAPFGAPQPQQPSPNCQLLAPLGVPEQQQFLKTEQFVKLEDAGGWMDGLMSPQAQTQMEVCIHPSREIQKTLILQM